MNKHFQAANPSADTRVGIGRRNAYHQAGYVTATCLANQLKQLPPANFQIVIKPHENNDYKLTRFERLYSKYKVIVEGGNLVKSLPVSFVDATRYLPWPQVEQLQNAFEADIFNLIAGPLAEAKYIANRENEVFSAKLIDTIGALHFHGGSQEILAINEYMECYIPNAADREKKLTVLYNAAFNFINNPTNWQYIVALAELICAQTKLVIKRNEVLALFDNINTLENYFKQANSSFVTKMWP